MQVIESILADASQIARIRRDIHAHPELCFEEKRTSDLIAGLEALREFNLGGFYVDFNPQKHTGSKYVDLTILTADGKVRH